ncbi:glycosyltransferase [uncultured Parabacteroides sp.]|uniref:glycosyltransferase n=1 Tax=uncultured Parabacteroides sp. TaxID=512312 RepID=UPI00260768E9|nr:glycosyltransferase [uncultured Parabacteroides sp.]
MNIMFMFDFPIIAHNGGVQRVTDVLAKEFVKRGHKVSFLCLSITGHQDTSEIEDAPCMQYYLSGKSDVAHEVRELAEKLSIDMVINQSFSNEAVPILRAFPQCVFKVQVFHSQPFATYKKERFILQGLTKTNSLAGTIFKYTGIIVPALVRNYYINGARRVFRRLLDSTDKLCLLSETYIDRFKRFLPDAPISKLTAINNPNTFSNIGTANECKRENVVLFVGRIENSSKNVFDFVRVWKLLMKHNPDWEAVVVGDGSDLERMKAFAQKLAVERISFKGNQANVGEYCAKAKFICCTSNYEGWPMVLVEAMQLGCVPVSYDTFEAVYDIIDDEKNGFIVTKKPSAMAQCIQQCIDGKFDYSALSQQAQIKVQKFSVTDIVDQWEDLIRQSIAI